MSNQWETAKHCHNALSVLLLNIQRQSGNRESYLPFDFDTETYQSVGANRPEESAFRSKWKRPKLDNSEEAISSRSGGSNEMTPPSVGSEQGPSGIGATPNHPSNRSFLMPPDPRVGFPGYDSAGSGDQPSHYSYSPLLMMNLSGLDDPQWPGGSASATNFDLNMTDLFQGSTWDMFDVQGQQNSYLNS